LKTALIKQVLDVFGPWSGVKWRDTSPKKLFEVWPSKAVYWELTCMLQADWYIIPETSLSEYSRDAVGRHPQRVEALRKYTKNITPVASIPFDEYDLVISFDDILDVSVKQSAVFAYYAQEHWDRLYGMSLQTPASGYDLFLAHMMDADYAITALPQAVSFPYVHDPGIARSVFSEAKEEQAWIDWRMLKTLAGQGLGDPWTSEAEAAGQRLHGILGTPIRYSGKAHEQTYGFADPPNWGDAAAYLKALAQCKYYVGVGGIGGAGQGLAEAASIGCLCIGQVGNQYHRVICHPACLCQDLAQMPARLRVLRESRSLQEEVLRHQDDALRDYFYQGPLNLLREAVKVKSTKYKT